MKHKLSALDLAFLSLEKKTTPVNVASLSLFEIPSDYKGNFARDLLEQLESQKAGYPFSYKLSSRFASKMPSWLEDEQFDLHYHVRHSALPKPGKFSDLLELVSRLHNRILDRERPLWEFYLIEGLENNCIAMYMKMHHACIDGMGGVELMENCFTLTPSKNIIAPWVGVKKSPKKIDKSGLVEKASTLSREIISTGSMILDVTKLLSSQGMKVVGIRDNSAPAPFTASKSLFNVPIDSSRRFAVQSISLQEIKEIGKQCNATVNDIVLALCSGALRNYMIEKGNLPKTSLIATVPVSVRQLNRSGNQISYIVADLATDEGDAFKRLEKISKSTKLAKEEIESISSDAATNFAVIAQGLTALLNQLNLSGFMPPPANVTISNLPGPRKPLFFGEAKLISNYPLSILVDGQALNITVVSYCDRIDFGFLACRDVIPDVQKISDSVHESLQVLKGRIKLDDMLGKKL